MKRLAIFPLPIVLLPGELLPLRIFEVRYLDMVVSCLRNQKPFVLTPVLDRRQAESSVSPIGTTAEITGWNKRENGTLLILVEGIQKVEILNPKSEANGLIVGQVEEKKDLDSEPDPKFYQFLSQEESQSNIANYFPETLKTSAISVAYEIAEKNDLSLQEKLSVFLERSGAEKLKILEKILQERLKPNATTTFH